MSLNARGKPAGGGTVKSISTAAFKWLVSEPCRAREYLHESLQFSGCVRQRESRCVHCHACELLFTKHCCPSMTRVPGGNMVQSANIKTSK